MNAKTFEAIADNVNMSVPRSDKEYLGADGFLHCSICHKRTQTEIDMLGTKRIVRCICDCEKARIESDKERYKQRLREENRRKCFSNPNMHGWTFANDDRKNPAISDAMQNYANDFVDFKRDGKGLLIHGPVGTGKSYLAACIANALIDKNYRVKMAKLTDLVSKLFNGDYKLIQELNEYDLVIYDDLGVERNTQYMQEQVAHIIDSRYSTGKPFIITTNLSTEKFKKPQDIEHARTYDRILERCFPVEVAGASRRRQNVKDTFFEVKKKLGL